MKAFQHPGDLNPFLRYRQARTFFKKTSRAKNPAWYQEALDLDYQLHIRSDGAGVSAYLYDRTGNIWGHGPPLNEKILLDPEAMVAYVGEAIKHVRSTGGTALGVILHVADEFALTEIKPDFQDRENLPALRDAAVSDPASILADSITQEQYAWRILPYFAPESPAIATAVTVSRRHDPVLAAIRAFGNSEDFPIITIALSAPILALLGVQESLNRSEKKPAVVIFQYPFFTVLAAFNQHSDLLIVRTQLHRGLRRPPNFRHAIATTTAALELVDPDLFVFALGEDVDRALVADLSVTFTKSHVEAVTIPDLGSLPPWCAECAIATKTPGENDDEITSLTIQGLRHEEWAFQDFLPSSAGTAAIFPKKSEMLLIRTSRIVALAALIMALAAIGWLVSGLYNIVSTPEWAFDPTEADTIKKRLVLLTAEQKKTQHWDRLLEDRSKGWIVMESLSRLVPEDSGILITQFNYTCRNDSSPGQPTVGFTRDWKISGLVKDDSLELLNKLNSREGISAHFNEIADATGNSAYRTDIGTRSVVINIRTQENSSYRPTAKASDSLVQGANQNITSYPSTFELGITQRFESTDPLALAVAKAP